ncbi:hypothetical protein BHM03_00034552 [Ensete ventricosum]|nr:hypothetical protein BHM03_00034552 [Ensete ventricosum]
MGRRRKVKYIGRQRDISLSSPEEEEEEVQADEEQQHFEKKRKCEVVEEERKKNNKNKRGKKCQNKKEKKKKARGDRERRDEATGDHEGEGAELEKPIMRQALREEARKHIGDTGLLDHLLKHMASGSGGGTTRRAQWSTGWRRSARRLGWRDPIEGAMEYWLHAPVMVR